jgi:hypothetical protein
MTNNITLKFKLELFLSQKERKDMHLQDKVEFTIQHQAQSYYYNLCGLC